MNWLQSIGLALMLYVVGGIMIASADLSEYTQGAYLILLGIGVLSLILGGVKHDEEEV